MRLLSKELLRFVARPVSWWVAAGMLVYVVTVVVLSAFTRLGPELAESAAAGTAAAEVAPYALVPVLLAAVSGALLVAGPAGELRALLTVEPRRDHVFRTKTVAAGLAVLPGVAVAYALLAAGLWGVAVTAGDQGDPGTTTDVAALAAQLAWSGVRLLALAVCAAATGAATGAVLGRWWTAIPVLLGALAGIEAGLAWLGAERWSVLTNARAWAAGPAGGGLPVGEAWGAAVGPWWLGGLLLLAAAAAVVALGLLLFRRRELR
ncbi:hypothetical protein GCM10028784_00170 [Myceligenerans cantabricum]